MKALYNCEGSRRLGVYRQKRPTQLVLCRRLVGELEGLGGRPVEGNGCAVSWSSSVLNHGG